MSAFEYLLILPLVLIGSYFVTGFVYAFGHVSQVVERITEFGERELILRNKVAMYDMTPAGATYYTELQEMHIRYAEPIAEYSLYMKNKAKYRRALFASGCMFWVYYMASIREHNRKAATALKEGSKKAEV